jgi:hypothetical protein
MSISQNVASNSSFVSIRYALSSKVLPDANEYEESQIPLIDIAALRSISQLVQSIKQKIAVGERSGPGNDSETDAAGDRSGSTTTSSNCSKNINQEENK